MSIYPNPLTGTTFTATLNNLAAGTYILTVINNYGSRKNINSCGWYSFAESNTKQPAGSRVYYIELSSAGTVISTTTLTAQ